MAVKVVVLDYDGTLVDSNRLKYEAYFRVFPETPENRKRIKAILDRIYELSRYTILAEIIREIEGLRDGPELGSRVAAAAEAYNDLVMEIAINCPEIPGARDLLEQLKERKIPTFLSSNTPEKYLDEIIRGRGWKGYFTALYGYPRKKADTVRMLLEREKLAPEELLVVGDGNSDRLAATENRTLFLPVSGGKLPLNKILNLLAGKSPC